MNSSLPKVDVLTEIDFSTTFPLELKLITTVAVPRFFGVKTNSSLALISAKTIFSSLFDFIVFTIAAEILSSSETTVFKSIIVGLNTETCEGKIELTTGAVLSGNTVMEGNQ
ncbi:hypothetical protein D9M71_769850 [compost metagenome]